MFFAALAGLAALGIAFALGSYATALKQPEQGYPSYRPTSEQPIQPDAARPLTKIASPPQYHTPCANPQSEGESNLCAQWHSARAAEDSAFWTKLGFLVGVFGLAGLYWQVGLTRKAVEDTGDATEAMKQQNVIAEQTVEHQLRAYVAVFAARAENFGPNRTPQFNIEARNTGQTPAIDLRTDSVFYLLASGELPPKSLPDMATNAGQILGAGQPAPSVPVFERSITDEEWGKLVNGNMRAYFTIYGEYTDIFGKAHTFGLHGYASELPDKMVVAVMPETAIFT